MKQKVMVRAKNAKIYIIEALVQIYRYQPDTEGKQKIRYTLVELLKNENEDPDVRAAAAWAIGELNDS